MNEALTLNTLQNPLLIAGVAVSLLVISDFYSFRPGRYLCKPIAALCFLWLAVIAGATDSSYGKWLLAGLALCALGDLLLMAENERSFIAGLAAFLCGHLLYAIAFLTLPSSLSGLALSGIPALVLMVSTIGWLKPRLDAQMKFPVMLYILVITTMLLCAGLTAGHSAAVLIITGAWGFAISDLAVARRQFVNNSPLNGLWGTPLYFLSQMLLAASVAIN